ncbi:uncharacterized protein LOC141678576 [Apium graveolens]|uniref:uncharacterized protein LOC141678576 n=1 Tax=Apium graveolens TaxID=4045 RepID=UPI003D78C8CE
MAETETTVVQSNLDPSSVYYIHPSDANTTQLVSVKFNGNNFNNWKRSMMLILSAKNKLSFVNGTLIPPEITSTDYSAWERCNSLVISWILFNLDETIARSVLFLKTARSIWKDLEERFGTSSITELYSLEQELIEISQNTQSVSEFYTRLKTVWDSIDDVDPTPVCTCEKCTCELGQKILKKQQERRLLQFLLKLNDKYSGVRGHIMMMNPLPTVSQAYRLVAQEENHKDLSQLSFQSESVAFVADKRNYISYNSQRFRPQNSQNFQNSQSSQNMSQNNQKFRPQSFMSKQPSKPGANYFCTHCKVQGHSIDRCFQVHGFPPGFKGFKERRPTSAAAAVMTQNFTDIQDFDNPQETSGPVNNGQQNPLTDVQYNQLMSLLHKQFPSNDHSSDTSTGHTLLAGPFEERTADASW